MPELETQQTSTLELHSLDQAPRFEQLSIAIAQLRVVHLAMTGPDTVSEPDQDVYRISRKLQIAILDPTSNNTGTELEINSRKPLNGMPYIQLGSYGSRLITPTLSTFVDEDSCSDIDTPQDLLNGAPDHYLHRTLHFVSLASTAHRFVKQRIQKQRSENQQNS